MYNPFIYYWTALTKYAVFEGRANRKEYWLFGFVTSFIYLALTYLDELFLLNPILSGIYLFATLLPSISVTIRRLHDVNKSGWWFLANLIPLLNLFVVYFMFKKGTEGDNHFGPSPD